MGIKDFKKWIMGFVCAKGDVPPTKDEWHVIVQMIHEIDDSGEPELIMTGDYIYSNQMMDTTTYPEANNQKEKKKSWSQKIKDFFF